MRFQSYSPPKLVLLLLALIAAVGVGTSASEASADSAEVIVSAADSGQVRAVVDISSTFCSSAGDCEWRGYGVEREAASSCSSDPEPLFGSSPSQDAAGSIHEDWIFHPSFSEQERLCLYLERGTDTLLLWEGLVVFPSESDPQPATAVAVPRIDPPAISSCPDALKQRRAIKQVLAVSKKRKAINAELRPRIAHKWAKRLQRHRTQLRSNAAWVAAVCG
jgi:hypothetical protein